MKENGDIDYEGFRELIEFQILECIDGILPLGTTGETHTLEEDEEERLIRAAVEAVKGRVPLIIGTGSNDTRHMVAYTRRAKDLGADAVLVVTPYYNKPNDSGLLRHFEAAAGLGIPVIVYNIASRTGRNIPTALLEKIARFPGIVGVKEASGDINQMGEVIERIAGGTAGETAGGGRPFAVLSGDDALTLPLMALGGDGVISVISNLVPARVKALTKAGLEGDFAEARRIHYQLLPLVREAFVETNPVPVKAAMNLAGPPAGPTRLPLGGHEPRNGETLRAVLEGLGIKARLSAK